MQSELQEITPTVTDEPDEEPDHSLVYQAVTDQRSMYLYPFLSMFHGMSDENSYLTLVLRGTPIAVTQLELFSLPEFILAGLSANIIDDIETVVDENGYVIPMDDFESSPAQVRVNFSPACVQYTLDKMRSSITNRPLKEQTSKNSGYGKEDDDDEEEEPCTPIQDDFSLTESSRDMIVEKSNPREIAKLLVNKNAMVVLREDLEYFCFPPDPEINAADFIPLKRLIGLQLTDIAAVFDSLGHVLTGSEQQPLSASSEMNSESVDNQSNKTVQKTSPMKYLEDMLCGAGFLLDQKWGVREMEPTRAVVSSVSIVPYEYEEPKDSEKVEVKKTEPPARVHNDSKSSVTISPDGVSVKDIESECSVREETVIDCDEDSLSTTDGEEEERRAEGEGEEDTSSEKLAYFWRKPARKCWWDKKIMEVENGNKTVKIKVHLRKIWTVEVCTME